MGLTHTQIKTYTHSQTIVHLHTLTHRHRYRDTHKQTQKKKTHRNTEHQRNYGRRQADTGSRMSIQNNTLSLKTHTPTPVTLTALVHGYHWCLPGNLAHIRPQKTTTLNDVLH